MRNIDLNQKLQIIYDYLTINFKFICNILKNIDSEPVPKLVKFKSEPECDDYYNSFKSEVLEEDPLAGN